MGRLLVPGRAVVAVDRCQWVDSWCRVTGQGRAVVAVASDRLVDSWCGPGCCRRSGRQMGRRLVLGLAVIIVAVDRW
eukprot:2379577-Rhodomonas_salina.1